MLSLQDLKLGIIKGDFTNDELDQLAQAVRYARSELLREKKRELQVGVTVQFRSRGQVFYGTVSSIKVKNAVVDTSAGRYRVPMNMLTVAQQVSA